MEFKTLSGTLDQSSNFDERLNVLVADGWKLVRREVLPLNDSYALYAELYKPSEADLAAEEKMLEPEPVTWQEAAQVLRDECEGAAGCDNRCPMHDWCQRNNPDGPPPSEWSDPALADSE